MKLYHPCCQVHKYPLRSQSRSSAGQAGPQGSRRSLPEHGKRELVALGASGSQPATRDSSEPSRLTRSGAVLRRSTRNSKGNVYIILIEFKSVNMRKEIESFLLCPNLFIYLVHQGWYKTKWCLKWINIFCLTVKSQIYFFNLDLNKLAQKLQYREY